MIKECKICKKEFEPYGRQLCCSKECMKANRKNTHKFYEQSDNCQEYRKRYEETNKRIQLKKRYAKTDKRKAYLKQHEHTPQRIAYMKRWRKTPTARLIQFRSNHKRRAFKNNIIEAFTIKEWQQMKEVTKGVCPCCKRNVGLSYITLDHIYPISKANDDYKRTGVKRVYTIDDIQPLCRSCNSSKLTKEINFMILNQVSI